LPPWELNPKHAKPWGMKLICKNMLWVELLHVMVHVELHQKPLEKNTKEVGSFFLNSKPNYMVRYHVIITGSVNIIVDHNIYIKDFMWTNWRLCEGPLAMFFLLVVPMLLLLAY